MGLPSWILLAAATVGCASARPRVEWQMNTGEDVVASNSPAVREALQPFKKGDSVVVDYPVLFENVGRDLAAVGLGHAKAEVEGVPVQVGCLVDGALVRVLLLKPAESRRASCEIRVATGAIASIGRRDAVMVLHVPIRSTFGQTEMRFHYQLWLRDFS
jgi:hypothetical protein